MSPRIKPRHFEGQESAERLAKWLNKEPFTPKQNNIQRLVWDIGDFLHLTKDLRKEGVAPDRNYRRTPLVRPTEPISDSWLDEDIRELTQEIEERMLPYWRSTHVAVRWPAAREQLLSDIAFETVWLENGECSEDETNAFLDLIALVRTGRLGHFCKCDTCSKWMFAKFPFGKRRQMACSRDCQKENRAYYMRDYQRKRKERDKKADEKAKAAVGYRRKK